MSDTTSQERPPLKLTPSQLPAFTAEDMTTYLQGAARCSLGPTLSGQPPTVQSVEFVGCKDLTNRLNVYIGPEDDALVCYIVLRGPFSLRMMSRAPGDRRGPPICETVEEIYDASTGRLLVAAADSFKPRQGF